MVDEAVSAFGGLDIVVVGSGMNDVGLIEDLTPERWQAVMDANVLGPWLLCRSAGRQFKRQGRGGKVVLVSSARSILGHPAGYSAYCPSKAAVDGIVRALGCEWGRLGITVNAIAPTVFRSPLTAWMFGDDEKARKTREIFLQRIPIGRLGEPADLAGPLLFLCSAASDFMTGQVIRPDGGYTAG
jgi:NAD(P)-dependent dehydrogenase (short-subunit alcohol dehydrogenase family)